MDTDRLNKWLTLAANIGVLIGLVFLALEVRQANRIAITSTELAVRNAYSEMNNAIYTNRNLAELLAKVSRPDFKLVGADWRLTPHFPKAMFTGCSTKRSERLNSSRNGGLILPITGSC